MLSPSMRRLVLLALVVLPVLVLAAIVGGWVAVILVGVGASMVAASLLQG